MSKYIAEQDLEFLVSHHLSTWDKMKRKPNLFLKIMIYIYAGMAILLLPSVFILSLASWVVAYPIWRYREKTEERAKASTSQSSESGSTKENI